MAVKRSCSLKNKSHCVCLKCGAQILPDDLKDNTVYKCVRCGQEMTVDRYDSRAVLTVIEKPDLRRRIPPEIMNAAPQQLHKADGKIKELRKEARDWERAADGLARWIEEIKEKEGAGNV